MRISLTALTDQGPRDVVVNGDSDMTVGTLARSLIATLNADVVNEPLAEVVRLPSARWVEDPLPPLWSGGRMLDPSARAFEALRDGSVVAVHPGRAPATVLAEPSGVAEIRVSGGPCAGSVHRLGIGSTSIGTAPDVDVRLSDPAMPPQALVVTVESRRVTVSGGGVLDEVPLSATDVVEWPPGGVLVCGGSVLTLAPTSAPDAHLAPLPEGGLAYNRPPRIRAHSGPRRIEVPQEPEKGQRERLRLLGSLLFAATGVVMVVFTGQWYWALMALAYPVIQVGEWIADRLYGRKSYKNALKEYRAKRAEFDGALESMRRADQAEWRALAPDPAEVLLTATGPRRRLWERRLGDPDTLHLRIGLADLPARIELRPGRGGGDEPSMPAPPIAHHVPVPLPLAELGVLGLSGPRDRSRALARWLVAQAAALHSPRDLAIVVLSTDPHAGECWNWVRWLPHCTPREGEDCVSLVGADPDTVARRVTELAIRITERRRAAEPSFTGVSGAPPGAYNILLVLDGARQLRRVPGMPQVLSGGPPAGLHAICIDDDERLLPEECAAVAVWDWDRPTHVRLHGNGLDSVGAVLADQVTPAWCDRLARALAPVRDVSRDDDESMIPSSVRLLDLLRLPSPSAADIQSVWRAGGRTTSVPIGMSADGAFSVDLRVDGPHGLIAGTTGAGKSELLQTLIASLAVANRPDEMTFVLIDYKGGAAFADCASLPHVAGVVTDLDGHLTSRALESLGAELRRRESLLLHAGAKDIETYAELFDAGDRRASVRIPRLVLVIDEFAAMAGELPDFVEGLVDIGRRGRSLGVHLLLATQRPAGVVTGDIRANTNLRVALRVTGPDESSDVLDDPSAARISKSTPGRCYVRSGAGAPVAVQAARIGGRRPGAGGTSAIPVQVAPMPWSRLARPLTVASPAAEDESTMVTDLKVLVAAIGEAATRAGIDEQPAPWLPPLPSHVTLDDLPAVFADDDDVAPLAFGLTDLPSAQSRSALVLDLVHGGHLYIAGSARSGRSTALRTLAGSVASSCSPSDVHLYAIDCGANALLPLVALPHCGAVVSRDQIERMERLLARLHTEVSRRQQILAATGFASLAEQRAAASPSDRLPWMLLMLDRWEGFVAAFENYDYGRLIDTVLRLLREGAAVGLRAVFTGDRSGLGGQVSTVFDDRLILRMADPNDYNYAGINERHVPADMPPGRAVELADVGGASLRESQIALLSADASGTAQVAALQRIARDAQRSHRLPAKPLRPLHVDELPVRVTYAEALALDPGFETPSPLWALVGAGGDEIGPVGVDLLAEGPGFTIAGPPRSGRSTALLTMVRYLLDPNTGDGTVPVVAVCPRRSPLRELDGEPGMLGVLDADAGEEAPGKAIGDHQRYVIAVDDAELLDRTDLDDVLVAQLRAARDGDHRLIIAGTTDEMTRMYNGFIADARRSRSGILLAAQSPDDGDVLGIRLPRNVSTTGPIGRGLIVNLGVGLPVQVAISPIS